MTSARAWPARAMYIILAAALAIGLFFTAAPAQKVSAAPDEVKAEWSMVDTPTMEGFVLAPESTILDFAVASGGDVAYAIVYAYDETYTTQTDRLLKSDDGAATWTDLTDVLDSQVEDDGYGYIDTLLRVETDGTDPDFIAVAVIVDNWTGDMTPVHVYISNDGGDTFFDAGEVADGTTYFAGPPSTYGVTDLAVSPEVSGKRDIAVGGGDVNNPAVGDGAGIFRATVTGDTVSAWKDGTDFPGFDDGVATESYYVTFLEFSPNYATDKTILITTAAYGSSTTSDDAVYLQCGSWGTTSPGWNDHSTLGIDAVPIIDNVVIPTDLAYIDARGMAGLTLPSDYNSKNTDTRVLWVWVNYWDYDYNTSTGTGDALSVIMRVDNDAADAVGRQVKSGTLWLTNVSYYGTIAEGKAIAGILGTGGMNYEEDDYSWSDLFTGCCEGVQVYRNTGINDMDICCQNWQKACKPPTGMAAMAVWYVSSDKAYAVALDGFDNGDEGAWSVSFDDGNTWNQLSLIDTFISYFSDTAVSPDCNKMWLVSVNKVEISYCGCDSVWLKATDLPEASEYSGFWLRVWNGHLEGEGFEADGPVGLIRLPADETAGDTVFLVDYDTSNVYMNDLEGLGCWTPIGSTTLDYIVDFAAPTADTLYALDYYGDVSMYDSEGWHDAVDSEVDYGWTIAVHGDYVLVGSAWDGQVSYSDDGGETFTLLDETVPIEYQECDDCTMYDADNGHTTVAFDTYFDTNDVIYAAIEGWYEGYSAGGIYDWVLGTSTDWTDLGAEHDLAYTGLVLSYLGGNPFTSADTGGVLYASYKYMEYDYARTGVARSLTPIVAEAVCPTCMENNWDYLYEGLPDRNTQFEAVPFALKACGCLTADSDTKLFAVEVRHDYNMIDGTYAGDVYYEDGRYFVDDTGGAVWTFEDCYAKKAVELVSPADGFVLGTSACGCCNVPFTVKWDRLCDACCYDIEFALDAAFTEPYQPYQFDTVSVADGMPDFSWYCPGTVIGPAAAQNPEAFLGCYFEPETTYYWRVRAVEAGTGQEIRSWWSDAQSFTVAPTASAAAIDLVSPAPGALNQPIKNVGFSWNMLATWDSFDWVLSANADLSSPLASETGVTSTAATYTGTLTHGMTYYWQVKAYNGGSLISTSAIGTFTTGALGPYCDPTTGLCFDTEQALKDYQATQPTPGTPFWVWVVIGIGAVLVIVVIVLIFRTRRV
jgi:hypothetical protein